MVHTEPSPLRGDPHAPHLAVVGERVRPVALARERTLPVDASLGDLFPDGGLPRGITVGVSGSGATSLALALAGAPTRAGSWLAVLGSPAIGLGAAAELGVELGRLAVVDPVGADRWATVVAALLEAVDVVQVTPIHRVRAGVARRLTARARERGAVLVSVGGPMAAPAAGWPEAPELSLVVEPLGWSGLGQGSGRLQARRVRVRASGRRSHGRHRDVELLLPGPAGSPLDGPAQDLPAATGPSSAAAG